MTAVIITVLIVVDYMLLHRLYDAANALHRRGRKRLFISEVQAGRSDQ